MKHSLEVTLFLLFIFFVAQVFGLVTVNNFIQPAVNETTGKVTIEYPDTVVGEIPEVKEEEKGYSFIPIMLAVLFGTLLIFLLIKLKISFLFKYWFLFAIFMTLFVTFGVYIPFKIALILAILLSLWKVFRPNIYIHNITEIFVYTGIAIIFVGFLNIWSALILLLLISLYDAYAVWKSKHMIKLAKFQSNAKIFAGLSIPYSLKSKTRSKKTKKSKKTKTKKSTSAILGGGDIAFPLLFCSAVMQHLIINLGITKIMSLFYGLLISLFATVALGFLLIKGKKNKFYPAMPFITAGCLLGYLIVLGIIFI